jgi:hypothetical protein
MITTIKQIPRCKGYNIVTKSINSTTDYGMDAIQFFGDISQKIGGII